MTAANARDAIAQQYSLRDGVKERIVFVRVAAQKVPASSGTAAKPRKLETLREGQKFGAQFDEYFVRVQNKAGEPLLREKTVDGKFMREVLFQKVGPAIRKAYSSLPKTVPIYLQFDNAGGHGGAEAIAGYTDMMREKFNIICVFQSPSSPDFNALDRGVWMSLQAATAKLTRGMRRDFAMLHDCVVGAWDAMSAGKIQNICNSVKVACEAALECDGGNTTSETRRSSKKNGVNLKVETYEEQSDDESDDSDEEEGGDWWNDVSDDDSDVDDADDDVE